MMFFHHENPHEATNGFVKAVTLQIFSKFSNVKFSPHCERYKDEEFQQKEKTNSQGVEFTNGTYHMTYKEVLVFKIITAH